MRTPENNWQKSSVTGSQRGQICVGSRRNSFSLLRCSAYPSQPYCLLYELLGGMNSLLPGDAEVADFEVPESRRRAEEVAV